MQFEIGLADQVLGVEAEVGGDGAVGDNEAALVVLDEEIVGHAINERAKAEPVGFAVPLPFRRRRGLRRKPSARLRPGALGNAAFTLLLRSANHPRTLAFHGVRRPRPTAA